MLRVTTRLRFIEQQLASPVDQPPEGKHWIHEIKHDGYRSQVVIERKEFLAEVERLTTSWGAFKSSRVTDVKWCEPRLVVRVKHLAGTKMLRHATVRGFKS
jgi:ATP-dependent DNA ligase